MSAPVIITTQSVLQYLQFEQWEFQPQAANDPISWNCTPLPPGMAFNPATGLISGAATKPGVFSVLLTATNSDGTSAPLAFAIGIEASSFSALFDAVDLSWDLASGDVSSSTTFSKIATLNDGETPLRDAVAWCKAGDQRMIHIRPMKAGVVLDIAFATLVLTLKNDDDEAPITTAAHFIRVGTGADTFYRLVLDLSDPAVTSALDDVSATAGADLVTLAELEATYPNSLLPAITDAPVTLRTTSRDFGLGIERQLHA